MSYILEPIGALRASGGKCRIELDKKYAPALEGLEGFSHINILWWFSGCDDAVSRSALTARPPYKSAPDEVGVFAARSPRRPNPIALDTARVLGIDRERAVIDISNIKAFDASPVLDIKPYFPNIDRVERPTSPEWCALWPRSLEESEGFDWSGLMRRE